MIRYLVLQWPSRFLACLWLQKHAVEVCSAQGFRWWQGALRHFNLLDMEKEKAKAGRNKTSDIFLIVHWLWSQTQWFVLMYMMWWLTIWQLKAYVYNLWPLTIFLDESRHPQLQRKTKDIGPSLQVSPLAFTHLEEMACSVWGFGIQISLKHFFLNTKFRLGSKLPIRIVGPIHMTVGLQGLNLNAAQFRICLWWTCWIWVLWRVNDFGFPIHKQTLLLHESQLFCQKKPLLSDWNWASQIVNFCVVELSNPLKNSVNCRMRIPSLAVRWQVRLGTGCRSRRAGLIKRA